MCPLPAQARELAGREAHRALRDDCDFWDVDEEFTRNHVEPPR